MGYHVSIVRTGERENSIRQEEIASIIEGQFGFTLDRNDIGSITQLSREVSGEEVLIFYDGNELWAKNPTETVLKVMIEIANALGNNARVRGDENETYESVTKTYIHSDDANLISESPKFYWKDLLSWTVPVLGALLLLYAIGKFLFNYLNKA